MANSVDIYVYDISKGIVEKISENIIGKKVVGIWHTSIVVYGKEYFFSKEVLCKPIGEFSKIKSITPSKIINYGTTNISEELFNERLEESKKLFTNEKYDLINNNCNHVTNYLCQFLLGKNIPDYILEQHKEYTETKHGKKIILWLQLLEKYYRSMGGNFNPFG